MVLAQIKERARCASTYRCTVAGYVQAANRR
jgi:hypothetical protein